MISPAVPTVALTAFGRVDRASDQGVSGVGRARVSGGSEPCKPWLESHRWDLFLWAHALAGAWWIVRSRCKAKRATNQDPRLNGR